MSFLNPQVQRRLMREVAKLKADPPEGIRVTTEDDSFNSLVGIIAGPENTPYEGGYFRVRFSFGDDFPAAPPKCWFVTKLFHPNVSKSGEICVNTLKKDWKSSYGIAHILVTIKCLLIYPNPESALDEEAGKLLLENYDDYCRRAKLITSVHATPRVRPAEFDEPTRSTPTESNGEASASTSSAAASTVPTPAPVAPTPVSRASASPASARGSTERTPPPAQDPVASALLATALASIPATPAAPTPLQPAKSNAMPEPSTIPIKPTGVKRPAAASSGLEKRKKALKRL